MKLEDIDLSDIEFWAKPWSERNAAFATLRRENPIAYFPEPILEPFPEGPGYFAITKMHDLLEISRHPEVFCSGQGAVSILDMPADMKTQIVGRGRRINRVAPMTVHCLFEDTTAE